jgi:antitoxin ParD1/3/4
MRFSLFDAYLHDPSTSKAVWGHPIALAILAKSCHNAYHPRMTTMNISLPDDMKAFVDQQVRARGYMSSSEYIRDLLRRAKDIDDFRALIQEGLDSGDPIPASEVFAELRARVATAK